MRNLKDQIRLLIAEYLLALAVKIAPEGHPDSFEIWWAAQQVFSRKPKSRTRAE